MFRKLFLLCLLCAVATVTSAQPRKRIDKAADLPRFSYAAPGDLEALVRDPVRFQAFAAQVRRDHEAVLAEYDIAEQATQRQFLGVLVQLDLLEGRHADALRRAGQIKALQEKPADKLLSGMLTRAIVAAAQQGADQNPQAYRREVARRIRSELDPLPYAVIENDIKGAKASAEFLGEALVLGRLREVLQPVASKSGTLSSDLAPGIISARYALTMVLPLKDSLVGAYTEYLQAHKVEKADIWAARDANLPGGRAYPPVRVAVWDSGVDAALFPDRLVRHSGKPAFIAFDLRGNPSDAELVPIPPAMQGELQLMQLRSKGLSDATSNIDSPEAAEVKRYLSTLAPAQYKQAIEGIRLTGNYQHGTHVAGISMAGNPYARLVNLRIEFGHTLLPDPCPSLELAQRSARNLASYVAFARQQSVRVVNMSWGGDVRGYEVAMEQCGIGKSGEERKALARSYFDLERTALRDAIAAAPEVLFVTSAGNSANDPSFNESYPSSIVLPNLVTVGAVDKAGDEAPFTSYGPTVALHANGYQVESYVPGGMRIALSGTSMSSPQVTNLAAKMLALNPALQPADVIRIMVETAEKSGDGRRTLVHPARALALATPK